MTMTGCYTDLCVKLAFESIFAFWVKFWFIIMPKLTGVALQVKSDSRELLIKLQGNVERERINGGPLIPVAQVQRVQGVAQAFGVSKRTVRNIIQEKFDPFGCEENILQTPKEKRRTKPMTEIDNFDADAIRNHLYSYYLRNDYLNRTKHLAFLRENGLFNGGKTKQRYNF